MPKRGGSALAVKGGVKKGKMYARKKPRASVSAQVKQALLNPRIGGFLGMELKFLDNEFDDQTLVTTIAGSEADPPGIGAQTAPGALNAIAQGDGPSNREGRQAVMKSIWIKGKINWSSLDSTVIAARKPVRLILFIDKQTNSAQFNSEDVLVDPTATELDMCAFTDLENQKRFKILKDMVVQAPVAATTSDADTIHTGFYSKYFSIFKKLNFTTNYTGTTAVVAGIMDNSLHLIALSDQGATDTVKLSYNARLRFMG